ncbi:MAG: hypothetical protein JAY71_19360 [Candidatus Thiodiazotropha weberae]|nr:hypothetical protein [Candidatus Thiodiazotropha weberae]
MNHYRLMVDSKPVTMLDPYCLPLVEIIAFVHGKFGPERVSKIKKVFYERRHISKRVPALE